MATCMQSADLGLLAGGTLLYEAAVSGLPCLVVSLNAAQQRRRTRSRGSAPRTTWAASETSGRAGWERRSISSPRPRVRGSMSSRGQALVDGRGCARVAQRIAALLG